MPASERSVQITNAYRDRLARLSAASAQATRRTWSASLEPDRLDSSSTAWVSIAAPALAAMQAAAVRLTAAYLGVYLASETGSRVAPPVIDESAFVGIARSGKTIAETLTPIVLTVKQAIGEGAGVTDALGQGLHRAVRVAGTETAATARAAQAQVMREDERVTGWRRVTHDGSCGACLGAATRTYASDVLLHVHDDCHCVAEPVVAGVRETFHRPDGHQIFDRLGIEGQNTLLGEPKAELIRTGAITLADLIEVSPMVAIPDEITEAPLSALQPQAG